jgi:hypothetical protein
MVEGTIMVPVFIILWLGVVYLQELYSARAQARAEARRCAFQHAMTGCGKVPDGCSSSPRVSSEEVKTADDIIADARTGTRDDLDPFQDIPLLGEAFRALFGTSTASSVEKQVPFPFDKERVGVARGEIVLLCNSQPTTVFDIAVDQFRKVFE